MPRKLTEQVHREAYLTNEIILKTELQIAKGQGQGTGLSDDDLKTIRQRVREDETDSASQNGMQDTHV